MNNFNMLFIGGFMLYLICLFIMFYYNNLNNYMMGGGGITKHRVNNSIGEINKPNIEYNNKIENMYLLETIETETDI